MKRGIGAAAACPAMRDITSTWTRPLVDSTTFHTILGILLDKKSRITLQNDTLAQSASQVNAISCNGEARGKQADQGGVAGASEAAKAAPTICTTSNHRPTTKTTATMVTDEHVLFSHRTSDSTYRIPTPPRIVVPPPMLNANSLPQITLNAQVRCRSLASCHQHSPHPLAIPPPGEPGTLVIGTHSMLLG